MPGHGKYNVRIDGAGWCAKPSDTDPWIDLNFRGYFVQMTGLTLQGKSFTIFKQNTPATKNLAITCNE